MYAASRPSFDSDGWPISTLSTTRVSLPDATSYAYTPSWETASAEVRAEGVRFQGATSTFTVVDRGRRLGDVTLQIPGRHYVLDALAALACGLRLGSGFPELARGLGAFSGTRPGWSSRARRAGCRCRQLRAPPQRDRR